jgi:hypothetical protein
MRKPAGAGRAQRRPITPKSQLALAGLAAAAIVVIIVVALAAPGGSMTPMTMTNSWLPPTLRVLAVVGYAAIVAVHLWHLRAGAARERAWHTTHVLMALGMIDMFAARSQPAVATQIGKVVFAVAAAATIAYIAAVVLRGQRLGWLWPATAAALAAMAYMYAMPIPGFTWLTWLLVGWLTLDALGWLTGVLPRAADLGAAKAVPPGEVDAEPGGAAPAAHRSSTHHLSVRVSLAAMSLGMAYMLLAMTFGMASPPATAPMPGMPGM